MKVVYHWWGNGCVTKTTPAILSIATLRAVNPTIEIILIDISEKPDDGWLYFQKKLNFKVVKVDARFKNWDHKHWQLFSRIPDVKAVNEGPTIYCDSDIFWFRDPLPLNQDPNKFCFDIWNAGFYYYNYTEDVSRTLQIFEGYSIAAMKDKRFCQLIKDSVNQIVAGKIGSDVEIYDEIVLGYLYMTHRELFNVIDTEEHCTIRSIHQPKNPKMFHCNGFSLGNDITGEKYCRALCCLVFEEFHKNMCKTLDQKEIDMFFSKRELDYYLPKQVPLLKNIQKFQNADLSASLRPVFFI
jgi:hypothetical protein